ncbi:MAG TPA: bifunctional oligoribonuclease/PAP phosphatase NrnA [Thermoclostridium sp.]
MKDLIDLIQKSNTIAIVTHTSADGDALGSSFGLAFALDAIGKKVSVFLGEPVPKMLDFLPGQHFISEYAGEKFDLCICLDTSDMKRLGDRDVIYSNAIKKITVDHHTTNNMQADGLWINETASATGEMVYKLIKALNTNISREIAINLYTAIVTDTGGFRYSNTTPESHIITADLLSKNIPSADIIKKVFDTVSYSKMLLMKKTLDNLALYYNGKVAVSYLLYEDIKLVDAQTDDFEGLVNVGRNLEGVEVSLFLREEQPGKFKGSLRANEYVDVAQIASVFAGGGHKRAAGFSIEGHLEESIRKVLDEIEKVL